MCRHPDFVEKANRQSAGRYLVLWMFCVIVYALRSPGLCAGQASSERKLNPVSQNAIRLVQEGKFEEARSQLLEDAHSNPGSSETFVLLGVTEIQLHDYSAARQALEKALRLNADSTDALYNLGVLSLEESRPKQAVTYFETAERKGRSGPELAVNLVRAQFEAGDRQEGLKTARDASRHFQDVPAFQLALGKVFLESKIAGEAVTSLKRAD